MVALHRGSRVVAESLKYKQTI